MAGCTCTFVSTQPVADDNHYTSPVQGPGVRRDQLAKLLIPLIPNFRGNVRERAAY
jgi:hypothetical protein